MAKKTLLSSKITRPPVVAVLGHVDHGKTSLLDQIRKTNVAGGESGGITQNIGAYQIEFHNQKITFIDTPGHVAFAKMRSRGAQVADLVILVVAADEGLKPQTLESLKYIREAGVNFIVAVNKIDIPTASVERVKQQLVENGVEIEDVGGKVVVVPISAKTGQGINDLLEMILLLAEMMNIESRKDDSLEAIVIESRFDHRRGALATAIIRQGELRVGDDIFVENVPARAKALFNERGESLLSAGPGWAVEIFGFKSLPSVGATITGISGTPSVAGTKGQMKSIVDEVNPGDTKLPILIKADTQGTLQAILASLPVEVSVCSSDVGDVSETDILLAKDFKAWVITFRVNVSSSVRKLAETEGVKIFSYKIIYEFLDSLDKEIFNRLNPDEKQNIAGKAEVLKEFGSGNDRIAGCRVIEGEIKKKDQLQLVRGETIIGRCRILSMKTMKATIEKAALGEEFGAILSPIVDFRAGDVLVSVKIDSKNG